MTSRPMGGSQPQRSLSANIIQRPPPNRTLSQQFPPSSPARRNNDGFIDLTLDGDAGVGRYATVPRNGGSRLRLEISKESKATSFVESPKPNSALTPTWRASAPPRGRPQLHFDVPSVSNLSPRPAQDGGNNDFVSKPMPLPVRPGQHAPPAYTRARISPRSILKKDARPKPYTLEVPTAAPHLPANSHADFFPWTGNHLEDQFSETAIRQGFYDKAQMTQNETGSAKPSIFPALKHKSGLQTLSSLFTSILTQRRAHGQINSSSTFKPPPRVTVTDTKREMWLKDLANPTISLRRLSRSIPHGIRGKVLLDQSLSKNIPIERAVWLAKCVGANELRSFRRKGVSGTFAMGGEAKWIRDFTVCVEQFVENIVTLCGEKDFTGKINYAIRLAAHFYAELLLDREHYMDWLVGMLENSVQAKLPIWLLITQIYWKDLLQYRRTGRRLTAALLNQLAETLNHPDTDILEPLSNRLKALVRDLMGSNPESFVSPKSWAKHRHIIQNSLAEGDPRIASVFSSIDGRNSRLSATGAKTGSSTRRRVIDLLDSTLSKPLTSALVKECWRLEDDKAALAQILLEWATSSYRPGTAKIYVALRMLRHWGRFGADITETTLNFLGSNGCEKGRNKHALYHLISELVRSDHFSPPIYLQWVIARGGLDDKTDVEPDGPCATRLLAELPIHSLSEAMTALRATLLSRVGISITGEEEETLTIMAMMNMSLPGMEDNNNFESTSPVLMDKNPDRLISNLSRTIKSEIGLWLRQKVKLQMLQPTIPPLDDWDDSPMKEGTSAITALQFTTIRSYLELLDDYSILADVLKSVTTSNDPEVLASCADTIGLHLDEFAAIGALNELFEGLMRRLRSLGDDDYFPRVLLVALSDLAAQLPEQEMIARQLAQELIRSDRKTAADACSPVSDHMVGVTQTAEVDFSDEIEKVLASGTSMDHATLDRLFHRVALRLEASWENCPEQHRSCGLLLTRLRTFDAQQFDLLLASWVNRFLQMDSRPSLIQVLGPLISFGCLALRDVVLNYAPDVMKTASSSSHITSRNSWELLTLLMSSCGLPNTMTAAEIYRLRIKQNEMHRGHYREVLSVIRRVLEDSDSRGNSHVDTYRPEIKCLLNGHKFQELLQRLILIDTNSITHVLVIPLLRGPSRGSADTISAIIDVLLTTKPRLDEGSPTPVETVLELADDYNLPFCQVKLAALFNADSAESSITDFGASERLQAFDVAIESAVASQNTSWACILPLLDISIAQHLRSRAETQFLALFPSTRATSPAGLTQHSQIKQAENLLYIIDATAYSMTAPSTNSGLVSEIVVALSSICFLLSNRQTQPPQVTDNILAKWLPLLLNFTSVHTTSFEPTKVGHESRARTLLSLAAIILELQALEMSSDLISALIEQTFDLALHLVDLLPDDVRQHCIRSLRDTSSNPCISYLFSIAVNSSEWLVLSQKERIGSAIGPDGRVVHIEKEKLAPYPLRRWEMLGEPTPNVGENDTSLSLTLFGARRG